MACLEKLALPVCVLLIRGKLVAFYVFRRLISQRRGRKRWAMAYQRHCRRISRVGLLMMNVYAIVPNL